MEAVVLDHAVSRCRELEGQYLEWLQHPYTATVLKHVQIHIRATEDSLLGEARTSDDIHRLRGYREGVAALLGIAQKALEQEQLFEHSAAEAKKRLLEEASLVRPHAEDETRNGRHPGREPGDAFDALAAIKRSRD